MTDRVRVGTVANMDADLLYRTKAVLSDGAIIEMVVWRLPSPVLESSHLFEYSLFYGFKGQRIVGYDNEREKGDHRHIDSRQEAYHFSTVDALISDFLDEIRKRRSRR